MPIMGAVAQRIDAVLKSTDKSMRACAIKKAIKAVYGVATNGKAFAEAIASLIDNNLIAVDDFIDDVPLYKCTRSRHFFYFR